MSRLVERVLAAGLDPMQKGTTFPFAGDGLSGKDHDAARDAGLHRAAPVWVRGCTGGRWISMPRAAA